jgi:glycosyltransferase involved in cell wall biosynthesis
MTDFFNEFKYRDIGVLISDSEGTPNVLIELMSKGIPCIYYNLDTNIDSPVINSLTGYNVDSLYELQSKLLKLKNNKKMYDLFSQNSRLHVESNYNSKLNLKEFLKIYEKL